MEHQTSQVQNAYSTSFAILSASPGMAYIGGSAYFAYHNPPRAQKIPRVLLLGDCIQISGPAVQAVPSDAHIHENTLKQHLLHFIIRA